MTDTQAVHGTEQRVITLCPVMSLLLAAFVPYLSRALTPKVHTA